MTDGSGNAPWVCGRCRSLNQPRSGRCYSCHTPRDFSAVEPDALPAYGRVDDRPDAPVPVYRDSSTRATLATLAIIVVAGLAFIAQLTGESELRRVLAEQAAPVNPFPPGLDPLDPAFDPLDPGLEPTAAPTPGAVTPGAPGGIPGIVMLAALAAAGGLALLAWAAWVSRVIDNLPALGVGYAKVSPRAAFFENVIPLYNLARVPPILRDVFERLDKSGVGDFMIAAAWLCLVGSVLLGRFAATILGLVVSPDDPGYADLVVGTVQVAAGLALAGALVLILIIWRIEGLASKKVEAVAES